MHRKGRRPKTKRLIAPLSSMPNATPTRDEISEKVKAVVKKAADGYGVPTNPILEEHYLREDLRVPDLIIAGMYKQFTKISKSYNGGKRVLKKDIAKQQRVKGCVDLVFKRAQGKTT